MGVQGGTVDRECEEEWLRLEGPGCENQTSQTSLGCGILVASYAGLRLTGIVSANGFVRFGSYHLIVFN